MESTMENTNANATPNPLPTPAPTPAAQPAPVQQPMYAQQPVYAPAPVAAAPQPAYAPAPQPAPSQAPVAQPTPAPAPAPAPVVQSTPVQQPVQQSAPQPTPVAAPAPQPTEEFTEEEPQEEKKEPKKVILNTQRILDDWKYEKGKVLIFFMKLIKLFAILFAIGLYIGGFIFLIGANVAIGFWEPIREIPNVEIFAPIMLVAATFLTIWVGFTNKLTPYFKAFSISKWLDKKEIDAKEIMKIVLQSRREKELTKYKKGRGGISAEKADLSQASFILLSEEHKSIYKKEFVCALLFWLFISLIQIAFIYFLSLVIAPICQQVKLIIEQTASFDFMSLINFALNPIFLGIIGGWIVLGIASVITIACVAHARNKKQQKWVKDEMEEFMPSEEYYEE